MGTSTAGNPAGLTGAIPPLPSSAALALPGAGEEGKTGGANMGTVLRALRRRWLPAVTLGAIALGLAAAAAWSFVPSKYTASTLLRVESNQPAILFSNPDARANFLNYQRTQLAVVKSRLVLNAALRQPAVSESRLLRDQADPIQWLEKELKADFALAPEVLRISLGGSTPNELTTVVNAVRDAYLREVVDKEKNDRQRRLEQLKRLSGEYEEFLRDRRRTLRGLAESVGSRDSQTLAHKHQFALERLSLAQKELFQIQSDLRKAQVEAAGLPDKDKAAAALQIAPELVEEFIQRDRLVEQLAAEVTRLEAAYDAAKQVPDRGDDHPMLRRPRTQLASARAALNARKEQLRPAAVAQVKARLRQDLAAKATQFETRIALLKGLESRLTEDIKRMEGETRSLNKGSIDLEALREDIAQAEDVAKKAGTEIEALKVELQAPSRVSVLEDAFVTNAEGEKRRLMATAGAGAGALGLVVVALVWWEVRARRIGTLDEVKQGLGLRLLGVIPPPQGGRKRGPGAESTRRLEQAVDGARTVLLNSTGAAAPRCVMVTSATGGEGKTSVATQLAASLARVGYRTLLIDGDLRRPAVHKIFGLSLESGLAELLRGQAEADQVVCPTAMDGLWVLPAGRCDEQSLQGLARGQGREVFRALREQYDFVVVDSTPVLPVADALLMGQHVDGVILSVLNEVSRTPAVLAAQERLGMLGVRVLGAVVNGVTPEVYGSAARYVAAAA